MEEQQPWHRLFGLSWIDFFRGLPVTVETEKDLSLKKQLLDILVIHKETVALECRLPDGFEELAAYNLISFKSHQQKLSTWSLNELVGHYVNLRKQVSPSMDEPDLLPADDFRLFAVSVRFPQQMASSNVLLEPVRQGVYDIPYIGGRIRLIVINQLPETESNAILHVFSNNGELLRYGVKHYHVRSSETSTILYDLLLKYRQENPIMPDALEEFTRQTIDRLLRELPPEKRLEGLSLKERLGDLSPEKILEGLSPEKREAMLRLLISKSNSTNPG
jgi:hypothetical protein